MLAAGNCWPSSSPALSAISHDTNPSDIDALSHGKGQWSIISRYSKAHRRSARYAVRASSVPFGTSMAICIDVCLRFLLQIRHPPDMAGRRASSLFARGGLDWFVWG